MNVKRALVTESMEYVIKNKNQSYLVVTRGRNYMYILMNKILFNITFLIGLRLIASYRIQYNLL